MAKKNISEMTLDFTLYPKQKLAMSHEHNSCCFGGAASGGKTHLNIRASIIWALTNPGIAIYLFRKQLQDLEKSYISAANGFPSVLRDFIDNGFVKVDLNKKKIMFKNGGAKRNSYIGGSIIHLCHLQKGENDLRGYEGQEIHALILDECCDFSQKEISFLRSRLRLGSWSMPDDSPFKQYKNYFPRMLMTTNPGGVGHAFLKSEWVDIAPPYTVVQMPPEKGGMRHIFIRSLVQDNTKIMEEEPNYINVLKGSNDKTRVRALLYGDWNISESGILAESWSYDDNIIEPFEIPSSWRIDRCMDWGSSSPFAITYFAESDGTSVKLFNGETRIFPKGTLFLIDELFGCDPTDPSKGLRLDDYKIGQMIKEHEDAYLSKYNVVPGNADGAMWQKSNKNKAIIDDINEGFFGRVIYNNEQLFLRFDKPAGSRKAGFALIRNLLEGAQAINKGDMERKGLYVFSNCKYTIQTVPMLQRSPKDPDDSDPYGNDHIADTMRYRVLAKNFVARTINASVY